MPLFFSPITKGFYDTDLITYPSLPDSLIELSRNERDHLIRECNSNNKVIVVVDGVITLQEKSLTMSDVRERRNMLLKLSDYTQTTDFPSGKKSEWASYRQALRDIPQTYSNASDVIWPTEPL